MISFHLTDPRFGTAISDLTSRVVTAELERNLSGDAALRLELALHGLSDQFALYDRPYLPDLEAYEQGGCIWRGRLEDVTITSDRGLRCTAYGPQRALDDATYTALWSDTSVARWRPISSSERGDTQPGRYTFDTNNRLYISPRKNEAQSTLTGGWFVYQTPDQGLRNIVGFSFSYSVLLPTDWLFHVFPLTTGFSAGASLFNLTGTGALQTGTQNLTFSGTPYLGIRIVRNNGVAAAHPNDEGVNYAILTSLRVLTQATPIRASDVAAHMASQIASTNPYQLSSSSAVITTTTNDYTDLRYEDAQVRDALAELAARERLEFGVDRNKRLYLRAAETVDIAAAQRIWSRVWRVDVSRLELARVLEELQNSVYSVYQDASGRALRTSTSADSTSVDRWQLTRWRAIRADTTSATLAGTLRDAALADGKQPAPRAAITIDRVLTLEGAPARRTDVAAGDVLIMAALSTRHSTTVDQVAAFRVARTRLALARGRRPVLEVEPTDPPRTLEVLLARQEAGLL